MLTEMLLNLALRLKEACGIIPITGKLYIPKIMVYIEKKIIA